MESDVIPYPWRVKDGAYHYMSKVLRFTGTVDSREDGQICRITHTGYTVTDNIGSAYQKIHLSDQVYQIAVLGISDRDFLILGSLLEPLGNATIYTDKSGEPLYQD